MHALPKVKHQRNIHMGQKMKKKIRGTSVRRIGKELWLIYAM